MRPHPREDIRVALERRRAVLEKTLRDAADDLRLKEDELLSWHEALAETLQANAAKQELARGRCGPSKRRPSAETARSGSGPLASIAEHCEEEGDCAALLSTVLAQVRALRREWERAVVGVRSLRRSAPPAADCLCLRHRFAALTDCMKAERERHASSCGLRSISGGWCDSWRPSQCCASEISSTSALWHRLDKSSVREDPAGRAVRVATPLDSPRKSVVRVRLVPHSVPDLSVKGLTHWCEALTNLEEPDPEYSPTAFERNINGNIGIIKAQSSKETSCAKVKEPEVEVSPPSTEPSDDEIMPLDATQHEKSEMIVNKTDKELHPLEVRMMNRIENLEKMMMQAIQTVEMVEEIFDR